LFVKSLRIIVIFIAIPIKSEHDEKSLKSFPRPFMGEEVL